jgi:osmotically-inducible protein OsmY
MLERNGRLFNDDELMRLVKDELRRYPDVDAAAIAVAGSGGRVTLRGTVGSDRERRAAGKAGANVFGVVAVDNARIARALGGKGAAESDQLRISASAGKVTITGSVRSSSQHDDAIAAASATPGVTELEDRIAVAP